MNKRLVAIVCAATLFAQTLPESEIAATIQEKFMRKSLSDDKLADNKKETSQDGQSKDKVKEDELGLDKVTFNAYINKTDQLLFSIGFDETEKKFTVKNQSDKKISEKTPEETMYTIKIFDKEQKEKFSLDLKGKDTGNSEKLEELKNLKYEVGDFIQITPTDSKDVLKITGSIQGDIDKQKEDYSDGVDNYDYIGNVRFKIEEDHLKSIYNEAPVINGLIDIENSENIKGDIFKGILVNDDHDGVIDNSKIKTELKELEDGSLEVKYTVADSWGRESSGTRKISPKKENVEVINESQSEEEKERTTSAGSSTTQQQTLANNTITVEGTPYYNGQHVRFQIRFDTVAKQLQVVEQDGRKLSNTGDKEYFKFVLYDKFMNVKTSVTLTGNDKSDSDKLDNIDNQLYEEGDFIGIWHAETKLGNGNESEAENNPNTSSFVPKLKIGGKIKVLKNVNGNLIDDTGVSDKNYSNGMDQKDISERRFKITKSGLKEVTNNAPVFSKLPDKEISRGQEFNPLEGIKEKITDDFDKFNDDNLETNVVSITYTPYDIKKVGEQTITYTAKDKWGRTSTATRKLKVTSDNPMDTKYIEFKKNNENNDGQSLFKIKFDSVEKKFLVENLDSVQEDAIDPSISSSIFKLKVYTKGGVLQKTLNIRGTDKLKDVLKEFDGYAYNIGDRIEVWSNNSKNIVIHGVDREEKKNEASSGGQDSEENEIQVSKNSNSNQSEKQDSDDYENYENGIDNTDFMKNVRFEMQDTKLMYVYNKAPQIKIEGSQLKIARNRIPTKEELMTGLSVEDDHDNKEELIKKVIVGNIDTSTIGEKEVEYTVVDSWGRSSLIKRKVMVYPYNNLEYNYINVKNNQTNDSILKIRFDEKTKKFVVDKIDKSKIPSSLRDNDKVFELKLIKKKGSSNAKSNEENNIGKNEEVKTVSLTKQDLINETKINEINQLSYEGFEYISLWVYDSKNGITVAKKPSSIIDDEILKSGNLQNDSSDETLLNGFDNEEKMQNTRFKIKSEGLEKIYNEGPKISGLNSTLYVYKNTDIKKSYALKDVNVTSNVDTTISNAEVTITDEDGNILKPESNEQGSLISRLFKRKSSESYINTSEIRNFNLLYKVTDSWGKTTTFTRTVSVISRSVSNDIEFYNEAGNENLFSLKYNSISNTFDVSKKENSETGSNPPSNNQTPSEQQPSQGEETSPLNQESGNTSPGDSVPEQGENNSQGSESSGGSSSEDNSSTQEEVVFKLSIFNANEQKVKEIELTETEAKSIDKIKEKLSNGIVYDNYYISVWSKTPQRIKIKGYMSGNNALGDSGNATVDYSNGTENSDYINNVRFQLTTDGINAIYNKAPEIIIKSKEIFTAYAGDSIDYTENVIVKDDKDNPDNENIIDNSKIKVRIIPKTNNEESTPGNGGSSDSNNESTEDSSSGNQEQTHTEETTEKTEEEKFLEEQKNNLRIGNNTVELTVEDSWGRSTTVQRNLLILNGIDKNKISFKGTNGEVIGIGFNHSTNKLDIQTYNKKFNNNGEITEYVTIKVYNSSGQVKVEKIAIPVDREVNDATLQALKTYTFEYGDYFEIYHGHPVRFSISGNVTDAREDYSDGVQNPENLLNVKFEITKSGLKAKYTNPDENNITNNKVVFGPISPEKFPFKLQIDFEQKKFKVVESTATQIRYEDSNNVYKMVLIRKNKSTGAVTKVRETTFLGTDIGSEIMKANEDGNNSNKNWNNQSFEYDDCLYLWHVEPARSIMKGYIKNQREDYSDGVNDIDNMNNVVFRLTPQGLESIYNNAPEIHGADDKDVYVGENFDANEGVTYSDDYDNDRLTKNISGDTVNTSQPGVYTVTYTATDRWNKTTTVNRKVTVRPNLYKSVFKIYPQITTTEGNTRIGEEVGDSNLENGSSSTQNKPWEYEENKIRNPAFEIGFDSITRKYRVFNQTNEQLSNTNLSNEAFTIEIKASNGTLKKKIALLGSDRGSSPKLDEINKVDYAYGDIIRVYRSDLKGIAITGNVSGHIPTIQQMQDDNNKFDYMKNTGFIVSNDGLEAKYNKAPEMNGVKKIRTVSKGNVNLLEDITVSDDIDNDVISVNDIYIYINDKLIGVSNSKNNNNSNRSELYKNYNFDKVGNYNVRYLVYDKWERATTIETTVKVESKVRENEISVYGEENLSSSENPAFRITFDTKNNKFVLKGKDDDSIVKEQEKKDEEESKKQENNSEDSNEEASLRTANEENYFEMVVRGINGEEKVAIKLNGNVEHDKAELKKLHNLAFTQYDTISLKAKHENAVKIKGNVILESSNENTKTSNNTYENGFGTTDKYSQVRFKITDDGLEEVKQKELTVSGITDKTIKRGDTLDLLEGVVVNVNDINNDDYKITVAEIENSNGTKVANDNTESGSDIGNNTQFKKLKEGTYKVRYTITNSWGTVKTIDRVITVEPRTDLEKVKLSVKNNENQVVLVIGFDSITKKLRVIEHKNTSIDYIDAYQVFEINAFDSLGKTIGTIALRGDQTINDSIINRINDFSYDEGYSLSVWSKEVENRINIEGTIKVDNDSEQEAKRLRYKRSLTSAEKIDKMENGRFKILSDGLKYIYNNAPVITGGDEAIPYYKGNLLKAPDSLEINDDHDGKISPTEVTVNDDNVDYDKLGEQQITYIVEDSWGRRATKKGKIEIKSAMDSNSINIYPVSTSGNNNESSQEPSNPGVDDTPETRTSDNENNNENITADGSNTSDNDQTQGGQDNSGTNSGGDTSAGESNGSNDSTTGGGSSNVDNEIVKNSGLSIKFVREDNKNKIKVDLGTKQNEKFNSSKPDEKFMTIKIYNADGTVLKSVDILGSDTGETAKTKIENELNKISSGNQENAGNSQTKNGENSEEDNSEDTSNGNSQGGSSSNNAEFEYSHGQYIAIEGITDETKNTVKIQGTVVNREIDYSNGISNLDKIQNVRFKFTDLGLEAVYNNAPIIKIDKNIKLDGNERKNVSNTETSTRTTTDSNEKIDYTDADGIKGDSFYYLRGVTLSDDHDTLTKDNVEVKWNSKFADDTNTYESTEVNSSNESSENEPKIENGIKVYGQQRVGKNTLYYKVTDSWGRVSFAQRSNIILKNGIFENKVNFDTQDKIKMNFEEVSNKDNVRLNFTVSNFNKLTEATEGQYYKVKLIKPNNQVVEVIINGRDNSEQVKNKLQTINQQEVPYGTKIEFYAGHPQNFSIEGPVRNAREDYSDGIQNPENITTAQFEITDCGLKASYITPDSDNLNENENLISLVAPEKLPLKIKIIPNGNGGGRFSVADSNATQIVYGNNDIVFTMTLKSSDGSVKRTIQIRGNQNGNDKKVLDQFNNFNYVFGDTLTITHITPKKVLIKGNIKNAREDYSDGVDNSLNLTEAVFELTQNGLQVIYRSAPKIMGIMDMQVEKGGTIDYNRLKESVSAKDNIDGSLTNSIKFLDDNGISTENVGMYEYRYQVTNSNQRTTTKSSTITVYDRPTIEKNEKATIELNSIQNNSESIKDYLKTAVNVSDDDDELYGKDTTIEVKSNNVNPNQQGKYKATYIATDLYGYSTEKEIEIEVVRTINVTVPTKLPFQVVTNLMPNENGTQENDGFVSGVLKLKNNNTSAVKVTVESFGKKADSGELEIVNPNDYNWNEISQEDSMKKMALGIYVKSGLNEAKYTNKEDSLWLSTNKQNSDSSDSDSSNQPSLRTGESTDSTEENVNIINKQLGILPRRESKTSEPAEASIGFTSKHGKNFKGGSVTGKFNLIFKFE